MCDNISLYLNAMALAKAMLQKDIISAKDYADFDLIMANKYCINLCSLYRPIDLIYPGFRAIMSHD